MANAHRKPGSPAIPFEDFMPRGSGDGEEDNRAGQLALAADLKAMAKENPLIKQTIPDDGKDPQ